MSDFLTIGAPVTLKSGGPVMTVVATVDNTPSVICRWDDQEAIFPVAMLKVSFLALAEKAWEALMERPVTPEQHARWAVEMPKVTVGLSINAALDAIDALLSSEQNATRLVTVQTVAAPPKPKE
jgi:uncharacterized protein YodC (DUF2158 family)